MTMQHFIKDPDEVLDYTFDWATWLGADTIATDSVTVSTGITKDSDSNNNTTVTVWLSGGTAGTSYKVTSQIVTAAARTAERTIIVEVRER